MSAPVLMESGTVSWHGLFGPALLDSWQRYFDRLPLEPARLSTGAQNPIRSTQVAWVRRNADTHDLYLRMEAIVLKLNAELFQFALSGLSTIQYGVYRDTETGHFDWHSDYGRQRSDPQQEPRKLTLSVQLSDGDSYEGGCMEIRTGHPVDIAPRERGTLIAFQSNALHRVTPIKRGVRRSLVAWATGPEFR
jgi:PKHD-type hydroxylase